MPQRVALTGTPGTGKSSVARELALLGWGVLDVAEYAKIEGFVVDVDEERGGALVLDEEAIAEALAADAWPESPVVVDSHIAHLLPAEAVVVLRTDPLALAERLRARGWPEAKVRENVEAEALSVVAEEVDHPRAWEIDTTERAAADVARDIDAAWQAGRWPERRRVGWDAGALPWV